MPFLPLEQPSGTKLSDLITGDIKPAKSGFTPLKDVVGAAEGALSFASGMVAPIVGGLAGAAKQGYASIMGQPQNPGGVGADVVRNVAQSLTYEPRTPEGQTVSRVLNYPFEKLQQANKWLGNKAFEATGSPLAGAGTEVAANALELFALGKAGKTVGKGFKALRKPTPEVAKPEPIVQPPEKPVGTVPEAPSDLPPPVRADVPKTEPMFKSQLSPESTKATAQLAKDFFEANPNLRRSNMQITDQVRQYIWSGDITPKKLAEYGLSKEQFANELRLTVSDAGRTLNAMSQIWKSAKPEDIKILEDSGFKAPDAFDMGRPMWKRGTDLWRSMLVTQPATAIRNLASQGIRVGVDAFTDAMDSAVQKVFRVPQKTQPLDGAEVVLKLFQRNKKVTSQILDRLPSERDRLFSNYLSDVQTMPKGVPHTLMGAAEKTASMLNILNRTQEFVLRRAVFQARLAQDMRAKGLSLDEAIKTNNWDMIPDESIKYAVERALHTTFAESPKYGTVSKAIIDFVNKVPGAALVLPFPRFLMNAIKYQYQYSPFGLLHFLSPAERAAFAAGNVSRMSKAIIGSAMLYAAFEFRNSQYAGEKWYEARTADGKTIDLRPYNPFAAYLFVADVMKRSHDGELYKLRTQDVVQGVLSTNMRAGTGLYIVDNILQDLVGAGADEAKLKQKLLEISGEYVSGFETPLATVRDIYDQWTQGYQTSKDIRQEPFMGPLKRQLPGLSQTLPNQTYPTRSGPKVNPYPVVRQLTGLSFQNPKNALEKELDRLGFEYQEVLKSTGNRPLDRKYRETMGAVMEKVGPAVVDSKGYQQADDYRKAVILETVLKEIRGEVFDAVNKTLTPEQQVERAIKKLSPRLRLLVLRNQKQQGQQ